MVADRTGGIMISPSPGLELIPLKPGSTTLPLPGIDSEVVARCSRDKGLFSNKKTLARNADGGL